MTHSSSDIASISAVLADLRRNGKIRVAMLFGSFAGGKPHERSDIDLAVYVVAGSEGEEIAIVDKILMSSERDVAILRLDDDDESPFIVQEALKGEHLVEPDVDTLYDVSLRALHEAESIRFRRGVEMVHGG